MDAANELFHSALRCLEEDYQHHEFYCERDVVWTVQREIRAGIARQRLPYKVFNDYPMLPGKRRAQSADLALVSGSGQVAVAVEFKYEPDHRRAGDGIMKQELPVVLWGMDGVARDVQRIREYVAQGLARYAFSIFIDEGGYFRHRPAHPGSEWRQWANGVAVLWGEAFGGPVAPGQV